MTDASVQSANSKRSSKRRLFRRKKKRNKNGDEVSVDGSAYSTDVSVSSKKKRFGRVKRFFKGGKSSSSVASTPKSSSSPPSSKTPPASSSPDAKEQYPSNEMKRRDMLKIPDEVLEDLQEVDEEEEDLYNKNRHNRNNAKQNGTDDTPLLQIVLLLIDSRTGRFELLQLEYDSPKAKVSDALSQIPKSVTEESIKNTVYQGVVNATGQYFDSSTRLTDVLTDSKKRLLVGVPTDTQPVDAVRKARPIINDTKVSRMLTSNDIEIEGWVAKHSAKSESDSDKPKTRGDLDLTPDESKPSSVVLPVLILLSILLVVGAVAVATVYQPERVQAVRTSISNYTAVLQDDIQTFRSKLPSLHQFVPKMALKK